MAHKFDHANWHAEPYINDALVHKRLYAMLAIKAIRSARSFSFLIPAKTILVPGMYFFGFTKYSNMCLSDHTMPEFLFASEYAKPSSVPEWRPKTPHRGGPCLALPPFSIPC